MSKENFDYLIIGAGITGLTVANELILRGAENICIQEKEDSPGIHASGRNSGVLHAGIYYSPDSLKARYCVEGNKLIKEFCLQNDLSLNVCGKVLVADNPDKHEGLKVIKKRADSNGVNSRLIGKDELKEIEPYAFTYENALYSPDTAVFNPKEIIDALFSKLLSTGKCKIILKSKFIKPVGNNTVLTTEGKFSFKKLINASGAHADRVAAHYGVGKQFRAIPFMGTYMELIREKSYLVNGNIYPVPDIRNPFLGVHITRAIDGTVYIGPTAVPVFGRESYDFFDDLGIESLNILLINMEMFIKNKSFRSNAVSEMKKYFSDFILQETKKLVPAIKKVDLRKSLKKGIRPQLVDIQKKELVMDFSVIKESDTLHVLNAISPAFTSSMAFAKYICDMIDV